MMVYDFFFLYKYAIYFHRIIFINIRMYSYQNRTLNIKYTNNSQLRQACALVWSIQITTDSNFVSDCVFVVVKLPMIIIVWWHAFRVNGNDKWLLWKRIELFYEFQTHRAHERIIYRLTNQISYANQCLISTNYSPVIHTLSSTFQWLSSIMETITIPIKCTSHVIENWKIIVKSKSSKNQISIRFQWSHHCKTRDTFQFPAKFNFRLFMNRLFLVCQIVK